MASGSSGRANNPGSKGFDFASDDILCSYEDYANQDSSNGSHHSDSVMGANSNKDFHKTRMSRASVFPAANVYSPPEESLNQEVISTVERTMKKYADNLMRFLEGISSRLSQLELYCYNLDKSIGEMRSDLVRDHNETDSKLKSLDKHLQEVRRSVQILRDKQELAETQKELAKLQLAQDSSSSGHSQHEERTPAPTSDSKKADDVSDLPNTQLALALPHQVAPLPSHPVRPVEPPQQLPQPPTVPPPTQPPPQSIPQLPPYYLAQSQPPQTPYLQSEPQYRAAPQLPPQPAPNQVNQAPHAQQFPQYQQQWPQQVTQPIQPPPQNQIRAPQSSVYPGYVPSQPANPNPTPPETLTSSMPMQVPFSGIPQPGVSRTEPPVPYGYGGAARPPPPMKGGGFPSQPGDGYAAGGPHQSISSGGPYMMYESEAGRPHHPPQPQFSQAGYPPSNVSLPNNNPQPPSSGGLMVRGPGPQSYVRSHPYNELIDKLVSMGYRGDHVASVIQRLDEMGQPVDFNAVLDRLNGHPSGGSQRGW